MTKMIELPAKTEFAISLSVFSRFHLHNIAFFKREFSLLFCEKHVFYTGENCVCTRNPLAPFIVTRHVSLLSVSDAFIDQVALLHVLSLLLYSENHITADDESLLFPVFSECDAPLDYNVNEMLTVETM